jgi:hypothetical protein
VELLQDFAAWLQTTSVSHAINQSAWLWAACETLHFLGMALLIGAIGVLDARMLGLFKQLPPKPLERLVPWGIAGFALNLATGAVFFIGAPGQYVGNVAFLFKMLFILLAGLNVAVFYLTGLGQRIGRLGPGDSAPATAKFVAVSSLFLWFGVLYWGRMLPFIGNAF